jgi:peptidoglycan/LPS O-acetylase OafA/YrhL
MLGCFLLSGLQVGNDFLSYFGLFFAAGSLLRAYPTVRKTVPTLMFLVMGCALMLFDQTKLGLAFVVPSLTIAIGLRSWGGLRDISRIGDLSYGIYIYAWPVQQTGVAFMGRQTSYLELLSITVPVTLALSAASWHLVERKALRLKPNPRPGSDAVDSVNVASGG